MESMRQMKSGKIIIITGTPGTGKDTVAKRLVRRGFVWVPLNSLVDQQKLWSRKEKGVKVVELRKLRQAVDAIIRDSKKSGKSIIIEGHLACELPIHCDLCIVLRTNPKILRKRLEARKYPKSKTLENIECELLDYCTQHAEENINGPIYEVDNSGSISKTMNVINLVLSGKGKRYRVGWIDWSRYI